MSRYKGQVLPTLSCHILSSPVVINSYLAVAGGLFQGEYVKRGKLKSVNPNIGKLFSPLHVMETWPILSQSSLACEFILSPHFTDREIEGPHS